MENAFKRDLRNYPLYFLLWTLLGLFYFSQGLTQRLRLNDPTPWWHYLVAWILGVYIWALLTPVILWLRRRFTVERRNWRERVALHLLLSAGFSVFELSLESALYSRLHLFPTMKDFRGAFVQLLIVGFHGGILNYGIVLGIQWAVLYYRGYQQRSRQVLQFELRASELQSQLMSAQLNALKMQLQPHFLFNTLNAITVLVRQQKSKDAEQMLGHLSDLLRGVLEDVDAQEVSLRRELEYLQLYLAIEMGRPMSGPRTWQHPCSQSRLRVPDDSTARSPFEDEEGFRNGASLQAATRNGKDPSTIGLAVSIRRKFHGD